MIPDQTCKNCHFFDNKPPMNDGFGLCRRYPPDSNDWPTVNETEWCGEFKTITGP